MLEKTFSLVVYLKKPKFHKDNDPYHVYLRITVDGVQVAISIKRTWDPTCWNARAGRAAGTKEDARSLNAFIDSYCIKVQEARRHLMVYIMEMLTTLFRAKLTQGLADFWVAANAAPNALVSDSGRISGVMAWTPELQVIRELVEPLAYVRFNAVLLNYYRER